MKKWLQEHLVCPECYAENTPLHMDVEEEHDDDVIEGALACPCCERRYSIHQGVAVVLPKMSEGVCFETTGYNSRIMLSSYLWSHYSEFFNGRNATDAYGKWASHFGKSNGFALDIGCSVGRLSFELSKTHSMVIGIDTSMSFIRKARELLFKQNLNFDMILEGEITEARSCEFDHGWRYDRVDFIVADALALPFKENFFSTVASVNVLDKVSSPIRHLQNVNKVMHSDKAFFLFSDPFSWDETVLDPEFWLSGRNTGKYGGRGIDNMVRIFSGEDSIFKPPLEICEKGSVNWKIRKTDNLSEHIISQFIIGKRR